MVLFEGRIARRSLYDGGWAFLGLVLRGRSSWLGGCSRGAHKGPRLVYGLVMVFVLCPFLCPFEDVRDWSRRLCYGEEHLFLKPELAGEYEVCMRRRRQGGEGGGG